MQVRIKETNFKASSISLPLKSKGANWVIIYKKPKGQEVIVILLTFQTKQVALLMDVTPTHPAGKHHRNTINRFSTAFLLPACTPFTPLDWCQKRAIK